MYSKRLYISFPFYVALTAFCCTTASAEMIYHSAERIIIGSGSQMDVNQKSTDILTAYNDDLISSGYVRDENRSIVGSVSMAASQTSTLTGDQIRGLGRGSGFGSGPGEGSGLSRMYVEFSIDRSMRFILSGQLRLAPHGAGLGLNGSEAFVRLSSTNGVALLEAQMDDTNVPDNLGIVDFSGSDRLTGVFPAGNYILEAMSEGHGSDGLTRCADFDFTLTALVNVPEPSGTGLLLMATLGLTLNRRRRR